WAELENLRAAADWLIDQQRWAELLTFARDLAPGVLNAAADAHRWYRAALDHVDHIDIQTRVDALGVLGQVEIIIGGDPREASWAISIALADEPGALHSPWAWIAHAMSTIQRGDPQSARSAAERAIRVAEARNDSFCLATATGELATALANLGELD